MVDVLWALGNELFFSSKDRDISKVRLMEVTPAVLTGPAAPKTPAKSLRKGLPRDGLPRKCDIGDRKPSQVPGRAAACPTSIS